jgi:hypothetical protein
MSLLDQTVQTVNYYSKVILFLIENSYWIKLLFLKLRNLRYEYQN